MKERKNQVKREHLDNGESIYQKPWESVTCLFFFLVNRDHHVIDESLVASHLQLVARSIHDPHGSKQEHDVLWIVRLNWADARGEVILFANIGGGIDTQVTHLEAEHPAASSAIIDPLLSISPTEYVLHHSYIFCVCKTLYLQCIVWTWSLALVSRLLCRLIRLRRMISVRSLEDQATDNTDLLKIVINYSTWQLLCSLVVMVQWQLLFTLDTWDDFSSVRQHWRTWHRCYLMIKY